MVGRRIPPEADIKTSVLINKSTLVLKFTRALHIHRCGANSLIWIRTYLDFIRGTHEEGERGHHEEER